MGRAWKRHWAAQRNQVYKQQYQQLQYDTNLKYKNKMFLKLSTVMIEQRSSVYILHWAIYIKYKKTFKNEQRNRDDTAKKRVNTSGVGESNNYEDIYNIYTSLQQHSLTTPIDSTH